MGIPFAGKKEGGNQLAAFLALPSACNNMHFDLKGDSCGEDRDHQVTCSAQQNARRSQAGVMPTSLAAPLALPYKRHEQLENQTSTKQHWAKSA